LYHGIHKKEDIIMYILSREQTLRRSTGISLIALIITIIVVIILAAIVIGVATGTPEKAELATFMADLSNIKEAVAYKRSINLMPKPDGAATDMNEGFTKVRLKRTTDSVAEDAWVVKLDEINVKNSSRGNDFNDVVENSEIIFGSGAPDIYIYDSTGEVYYAKGYKGEWQTTYNIGDTIDDDTIIDVEAENPSYWDFDATTGTIYEYIGPATNELLVPNKINGVRVSEIRGTRGDFGDAMIRWNSGVESVIISPGISRIGYNCFEWCDTITSVSIPNTVTSIGEYAFQGTGLQTLTLPSSLTTIETQAFYYGEFLTSITIPKSVNIIGESTFDFCYDLQNINVDPDNASYKSIDGVLYSKDGTLLHSYPIGNTRTTYTIPDGVQNIGVRAFFESSLTGVTIPNGVVNIGMEAFSGSAELTQVSIPSSVTSIGQYAFQYNYSLTNINVDPANTAYKSIDGVLFNKSGTTLILYSIGNTRTSYTIPNGVVDIYENAFRECEILTSVSIPSGVKNIQDGAFRWCSELTSINLSDGLETIGWASFYYCPKLASITLPNSLISIDGSAFSSSGLTSITIPSNVISIGSGAFNDCLKLAQILIKKPTNSILGENWGAPASTVVRWNQ
jgi:Tfp pilus assembly major pilin PilA